MIPTSLRRRHGIEGGDILRWSINDDDDEDDVDIDVELVS